MGRRKHGENGAVVFQPKKNGKIDRKKRDIQ
jgi:hypothetical protein